MDYGVLNAHLDLEVSNLNLGLLLLSMWWCFVFIILGINSDALSFSLSDISNCSFCKWGFMVNENWYCVALIKAKITLYIIKSTSRPLLETRLIQFHLMYRRQEAMVKYKKEYNLWCVVELTPDCAIILVSTMNWLIATWDVANLSPLLIMLQTSSRQLRVKNGHIDIEFINIDGFIIDY